MQINVWPRWLAAALVWAAIAAAPGLPLPAADRLSLAGTAAAQEAIDIDSFYDELAPYGEWVWHPRYGYVWLPEDVSPRWRPYTVGRWTYTDEFGWYWDSYEPFAWAVYHYGRWGYDPDYGWFWVPGDTWAPAWVQWRYSDDYVGWAPIGPGRRGYAYGVPVSYEPPIAESWVFVQPRYMTSRAISHYALPIGNLNVAFFAATNVYRPIYRGGVVYNYGMPRDRVVKIIKRPIYVQKIYKVDRRRGGKYDRDDRNNGIKVYAPRFEKNSRPDRRPKKFVDDPRNFKPKTKLHDTYKGEPPKGWGRSAKDVKSIVKEDPEGFKNKHRFDGNDQDFGDRDNDNNRGKDKDRASKDFDRDKGNNNNQADFDKGKNKGQGNKGRDRKGNDDVGAAPPPNLPPPVVKDGTGDGALGKAKNNKNDGTGSADVRTQTERGTLRQGDTDDDNQNNNKNKNKNKFGSQGGTNQFKQGERDDNNRNKNQFGTQGGPDQFKQGSRDDNDRGDNNNRKNKNKNQNFGNQGSPDQFKQGDRDDNNRNKNKFGNQGGPSQFRQGSSGDANNGGGGGGGGGKNNNKKDKCERHPEKPECQ